MPLETERGYNTTLPAGALDLKTHVTFSNHAFVVSKIGEGVRVGGAVELGGLKLAPNMKRAEFLLAKAKTFLPGLKTEGGVQWMGFRPSMPDSLPFISPSSATPAIVYAYRHGHLGLTRNRRARRKSPPISSRAGHPHRHERNRSAPSASETSETPWPITPSNASTATPAAIRSVWSPAAARASKAPT